MKCEKCGYELNGEVKQCPNCFPKEEFILFCSGCGNKLNEDHSFCPKCGKPIQKDTVYNSPIKVDEKSKVIKMFKTKESSKLKQAILKFILSGIGICLLLIIAMILVGDWLDIVGEVFITIYYLSLFGYVANTLVNLYEKTEYDVIAVSGLTICGILFCELMLELWGLIDISKLHFISKILLSLFIGLIGFWHSAKLLCINIKNSDAQKARRITMPLLFTTYILIIIISFFELEIDILIRIMIILILLTAFGSISIPILNKIKKDR